MRRSVWRRRGGGVVFGGLLAVVTSSSCTSPVASTVREALVVQRTTFAHRGFGAGPVVFTDDAGRLVEERRYEAFGVPIDAHLVSAGSEMLGKPDLVARDVNPLGQRTEVATGWSDHGARWMAPESGRWLSPDPPVVGPDPELMAAPWQSHPYQYVDQNPVAYWDPDGRAPAINQVAPTPPPPPKRTVSDRVLGVFQALESQRRPDMLRAARVLGRGWDLRARSLTSPPSSPSSAYDLRIEGTTKDVFTSIERLADLAPIHRLMIDDHGHEGVQTFGPDDLLDVGAAKVGPSIDPSLLLLAGKFAPDGVLVLGGCNIMDGANDEERQRNVRGLQYLSKTLGVEVIAGEDVKFGEDTIAGHNVTSCRGDQCVTGWSERGGPDSVEAKWEERSEGGH